MDRSFEFFRNADLNANGFFQNLYRRRERSRS